MLFLRDATLVDPAAPDRPVGAVSQANPLSSPLELPEKLLARVLVCWSGWASEDTSRDPESVDRDLRTWSRGAWERLGHWCDELIPQLRERGIEVWLRPHARHVLSDPQSCVSFFARRDGQPIRLLLEPAAFLTADMLLRAEEHLERAFVALGSHASVAGVLLSNRVRGSDSEDLRSCPLHQGELNAEYVVRMWRQHVSAGLPTIILATDTEAQVRLLGPA